MSPINHFYAFCGESRRRRRNAESSFAWLWRGTNAMTKIVLRHEHIDGVALLNHVLWARRSAVSYEGTRCSRTMRGGLSLGAIHHPSNNDDFGLQQETKTQTSSAGDLITNRQDISSTPSQCVNDKTKAEFMTQPKTGTRTSRREVSVINGEE